MIIMEKFQNLTLHIISKSPPPSRNLSRGVQSFLAFQGRRGAESPLPQNIYGKKTFINELKKHEELSHP